MTPAWLHSPELELQLPLLHTWAFPLQSQMIAAVFYQNMMQFSEDSGTH
jgi:hypothetical protein